MINFPVLLADVEIDLGGNAKNQVGAQLPYANEGFGAYVGMLLQALMAIAALVLLIYLVWGGMDWLTSGGEKGKIEQAKNKITSSIVGIFLLASALAFFMLIQGFLGIEILKFSSSAPSKPVEGDVSVGDDTL